MTKGCISFDDTALFTLTINLLIYSARNTQNHAVPQAAAPGSA